MDLHERFEQFSEEHGAFGLIEKKHSNRPDLHAFLTLDGKFPNPGFDIVCGASHDEIYLAISDDEADLLTDNEIRDLVRCGVRHSSEGGLCMFA